MVSPAGRATTTPSRLSSNSASFTGSLLRRSPASGGIRRSLGGSRDRGEEFFGDGPQWLEFSGLKSLVQGAELTVAPYGEWASLRDVHQSPSLTRAGRGSARGLPS